MTGHKQGPRGNRVREIRLGRRVSGRPEDLHTNGLRFGVKSVKEDRIYISSHGVSLAPQTHPSRGMPHICAGYLIAISAEQVKNSNNQITPFTRSSKTLPAYWVALVSFLSLRLTPFSDLDSSLSPIFSIYFFPPLLWTSIVFLLEYCNRLWMSLPLSLLASYSLFTTQKPEYF